MCGLSGQGAGEWLSVLRGVLGAERDPMLLVWAEQATTKDRRLLLAMAGEPPGSARILAGRAWLDLSPELRARVKGGLRRFSAWAGRLQ